MTPSDKGKKKKNCRGYNELTINERSPVSMLHSRKINGLQYSLQVYRTLDFTNKHEHWVMKTIILNVKKDLYLDTDHIGFQLSG